MAGLSKIITIFFAFIFILLLGAVALFFFDQSGTAVYKIGFSRDKKILAEMSVSFFEDIQFKDFESSSRYHSPEDQENVDIPDLIERIFIIKPELLDIMRYRIIRIHIDRSTNRARVFMNVYFRVLNSDRETDKDLILYFYKDHRDKWYMKLESSLR